ncbi:virulence factor SrfC family protein [Enterobacteriaceae bacterium H18W14]|uniref:virulence factor SrfC family protein n=1 Tax=Dryocola boscaweniae TaxID=2925397 RepID=UPI0022F0F110|nr:virulence factor SrfC family protein [Dryocola boscaweniae]MCT4716972.1 virulence factor SrfC family protein [Dryocola boscaweniae]
MNQPTVSQPKNVLQDLTSWIQDTRAYAPLLESEADGLLAQMLPLQRRQQQLEALSAQPPALGLYGHSVAGKHHLLSALLANHTGRIEIALGEKTLDYLTHINPGHSTATLAVRFSENAAPAVENFPLLLTLFNESDLAQRIIREYHARPEPRVAQSSVIAARIAELQTRRQAQIVAGISSQQVADIARCYHAQLRRQHHPEDALWQQMADLIPRLTPSDRVSLLALFWGDDANLTAQWQHLSDTLHHIGETSRVLAPASLLVDTFLLPAEGFLIPATPNEPELQADVMICPLLGNEAGSPVSLAQRDLLALCAEVCLTLSNAPALRNVDIIDIPLAQIDYYTDRLEPDTLLVCNAACERTEVKSAGKALARWVDNTQGAQAALPGLIWTITPFDARFTQNASVDDGVQRLIGQAGKRWGTLQALDSRNMHRLLEWLTDAINGERRARRIAILQNAVNTRTGEIFQRFSDAHSVTPETARQQAESLVRALQSNAALHGELLASLVPERHALLQCWQRHHQQATKRPAGFQLDIDLFADDDGENPQEMNPASYASEAHKLWVAHLRSLAQRADAAQLFGLDNAQLRALCDLLIIASLRLKLPDLLEEALQSGDGSMAQEITCASNVLGDFVNWLGYAVVPQSNRPASRVNKGAKIFAPQAQAQASKRLTKLGETPARGNASYVYDWLVALYARAVENIGYRHPHDVSDLHREKLRELLSKASNSR